MSATMSKAQRRAAAFDRIHEAGFYITNQEMLALLAGYVRECKQTRNSTGDALLAARLREVAKGYRERPWLMPEGTHADMGLLLGEAIGLLA